MQECQKAGGGFLIAGGDAPVVAQGIAAGVNLNVEATPAAPNGPRLLLLLCPAAYWWALTLVESISKGDSVRASIQRKAIKHEKIVKGYVLDFSVLLIGEEDTVLVRQFNIWLKEDFPISNI